MMNIIKSILARNNMEISKYRYFGRLTGLVDALGMKASQLSPDDYYRLPRDRMVLYTAQGIGRNHCQDLCNKLQQLSGDAKLPPSNQYEEQEYKIGLREGMKMVRNNDNLMRLTLPIDYWNL